MRVLFAYINSTKSFDMPLGIGYLSGMLKAHGYKSELLNFTWKIDSYYLISRMRAFDVLALSATTLEFNEALKVAEQWRRVNDGPIVLGGCKPTVEPEESIMNPLIDAICIGEGEHALLSFVEGYERLGTIPRNVESFWTKTDGNKIYRNSLRFLVEDLDVLPFPNWSIFDERHIELKYPGTAILTSRGCPFHCSMCVNHYLQKLYVGLGKYTRYRSVNNILEEIAELRESYNIKRLFFIDDTFTINHKRLEGFCRRYKKEIDIPFLVMGRCNTITEKLITMLKNAGCIYIGYGVEAGNSRIRNDVLKRDMADKQIINAFDLTRKAGIKTASYNMIGVPTETRKEIFETIELNRRIKPDIVQTTLLYPFPGTEIHKIVKNQGLLLSSDPSQSNYYTNNIVKIEGLSPRKLYALELAVPFYVHFPKYLWWFVRILEWTFSKTTKFNRLIPVFRKKVLERKFFKEMT